MNFNKNMISDERIQQSRQKILSEAFYIIVILLCASILIKTLVFHMNGSDLATEFSVLMIGSLYVNIKAIRKGSFPINFNAGASKNKRLSQIVVNNLTGGLISGILIGAILYFVNGTKLGDAILYSLIFALAFTVVKVLVIYALNYFSTKKLDNDMKKIY